MIRVHRRGFGWSIPALLGILAWPLVAQDPPGEPAVATDASGNPVVEKVLRGKSEMAQKISARNAFGLVDPAPPVQPPPPPTPPAPPPQLHTIHLTGFSNWAGERKVYLVVNRQGGKAPEYYDLREGDERGDIRIVQIDDRNETAQIVNNGTEQTLNFKDNSPNSSTPVAGVPGTPGVVGQPVPPPPMNTANRFPGGAGPTVIGRGGEGHNVSGNPNPAGTEFGNSTPGPGFNGGGNPSVGGTFINGAPVNPQTPAPITANPAASRSRFNIPPPPLPPVN